MRASRSGLLASLLACLAAACAAPAPRPAEPAAAPAGAAAAVPAAGPATAPAVAALAPTAAPALQPISPPQIVRVDSLGLGAEAPLYLAIELGYFQELGLDVQLVPLAGTNDNIPLLSSDQLDVGGALVGAGIFNAVARGVGIRMVADRGSTLPGRTTSSLAVRTDLLELKPWTGYGDLRGLKLGHAQPGSQTEYWLERMLDRGGLQRDDLEIIAPFTFQDVALAFANKALDAAIDNEPWATQQELQGVIKKVAYMDDVAPGMPTATVLYSETFARNTPAARNYLVGWLRGVRAYWDAYDGRRDFADLIAVLQKYTALKDETLIRKVPPTGQSPAGYLDPTTLATLQDWFAEKGLVPRKADVAQVYDPSFADYANAVLGPYQPVKDPRRPD